MPASTERWAPAPMPPDELERRRRLAAVGLIEGQRHEVLDHLTHLASELFGTPIALVSLVTADEQVFISRQGLAVSRTGRPESFCGHCAVLREVLAVGDAHADPRFARNPLVVGAPSVRAYLGVPLLGGPGQSAVGTLCVIDREPRTWTEAEAERLRRLATIAERYLEGLPARRLWDDSPLSLMLLDAEGRVVQANPALGRLTGQPTAALLDRPLSAYLLPADRGVLAAMIAHTLEHRASPTRRELRFVRLGGEVVSAGVSVSPVIEVPGQVACVIRDISLELRGRAGVLTAVRDELSRPVDEARGLAEDILALTGPEVRPRVLELAAKLEAQRTLVGARMSDIGGQMRAEEALRASEARLRAVVEHVLGPLLVLDDRGRIVDANSGATAALGWEYEALVGASMRVVQPDFTEARCRRWFASAVSVSAGDEEPLAGEHATFVRRDGAPLEVELRGLVMDWNGPGRLVLIARDISRSRARETQLLLEREDLAAREERRLEDLAEQHRMEEALRASLAEKETLLREIHHRVKNNLQIVASLLSLQMDQTEEDRARTTLSESVNRLRSMALIHQQLYGSTSLERIDLADYARSLAESLRFGLAPNARLLVDARPVEVTVETAVPVGLILNELLTNAFKYGVPEPRREDRDHDVSVELGAEAGVLRLLVRDHGPGLPPGFALGASSSLGLQLVRTLTRQLRGRVEARSDDGAVFELTCKL